jgi:hypothetical protein
MILRTLSGTGCHITPRRQANVTNHERLLASDLLGPRVITL